MCIFNKILKWQQIHILCFSVSARLTNVYSTWSTGRVSNELFTLHTTILYSETSVRYMPTSWQIFQAGWAKLFPVLVISVIVFRAVKNFIFSNQLVYTYKEVPWKKTYWHELIWKDLHSYVIESKTSLV